MTSNLFLAALPSRDNGITMTQKISVCEAKRSPLVKVQWTYTADLHITLGFIEQAASQDVRTISLGFMPLTQQPAFMAHIEGVRLYGNAIVCQTGPVQLFQGIHRQMEHALEKCTNQQYHFLKDKRYTPHLTLGRIQNLKAVNNQHREQLLQLIETEFRQYGFMIYQAALLKHTLDRSLPSYEILQQYLLRR